MTVITSKQLFMGDNNPENELGISHPLQMTLRRFSTSVAVFTDGLGQLSFYPKVIHDQPSVGSTNTVFLLMLAVASVC